MGSRGRNRCLDITSSRRVKHDSYASFTPPTPTRQDCSCRRCELNWRQDKTVFSSPEYIIYLRLNSCKLETGSRQDKTQFTTHFETRQKCLVLSQIQFTPQTQTRQDETFCLVRVGGVK